MRRPCSYEADAAGDKQDQVHMMIHASIAIGMQKSEAELVFKALGPDVSSSERAEVAMDFDGKGTLNIRVVASDTVSLRAALNTILRQIKLIENVMELKLGE